MTIAFDHRQLHPIDGAMLTLRASQRAAVRSRAVVALVAAFVLPSSAGGVLAMRVHVVRSEERVDLARLDRTTAAAAPAKAILSKIAELRTLAEELSEARRSGDDAADELARLGNAFPSHVWIARFRRDGHALIVDGGAGSVDAVGRALVSLGDDHAHAQLMGFKDAGRPGAPSDIRYSLRIDPR